MARQIMQQILKTGRVSRGYIGAGIQEVTSELAKAFDLPAAQGALIGSVEPNGAGAKAGLQKGDVITALDGQLVMEASELRLRISQMAPGTVVKLDFLRSGQKHEVTVTLDEYPEKTEAERIYANKKCYRGGAG